MMRNELLILAVAIAGLAGCGHPLPRPVDLLSGMEVTSHKPSQQIDLRPFQNRKIGLILSENTRNSIQWRKVEIDRLNRSYAGVSWTTSSDADPVQSSDHSGLAISVERVLKEKFKDITLVPDLHAAIDEGINTVVVIDIQATEERTCPSTMSDCYLDTRSQHSLVFVDTQTRNPLAIIRGDASITYCDLPRVDYAFAYAKCIQDGRIKSLEVLRGKLDALLPDRNDKQEAAVQKNIAGTPETSGYEENRNTIENGAPAEMYSLGLRMEQSGNAALAGLVYQAIVRRHPDSPFAAKALERQEAMIAHY